jgi:hypothetical protein
MRLACYRAAASNIKVLVIVLICLGVFGLLAVGACVGLGFFAFKKVGQELDAAKAPAEAFFDQLKAGQIDAAWQSADADFQAQQTLAEFKAFVGRNPNLTNHISRDSSGFNMTTVGGIKQATLPYTLTGPPGVSTCTVVVQDSGGGWKVHKLTVP